MGIRLFHKAMLFAFTCAIRPTGWISWAGMSISKCNCTLLWECWRTPILSTSHMCIEPMARGHLKWHWPNTDNLLNPSRAIWKSLMVCWANISSSAGMSWFGLISHWPTLFNLLISWSPSCLMISLTCWLIKRECGRCLSWRLTFNLRDGLNDHATM